MKNVMVGRFGGFMEEREKCCHAALVSASSARESRCRWTLNQVQGDGLTAKTKQQTARSWTTTFQDDVKVEKGGFTLIELLVVVLIIGILAAIAVPQYELAVEKARAAEALSVLKSIKQAGDLCVLQQGGMRDGYLCGFDEIDLDLPGFDCSNPMYCNGKNFEYNCDTKGCMFPYANPAGNLEYY